ncbi:MAG: hypothetical protein AB1656_08455 [Candidatus Omnitrophota bacterium]
MNNEIKDELFREESPYFELDGNLYSPSLSKQTRLSIARRIYNPATLPFFGFFFLFFSVIPIAYNFFQLRKWIHLSASILLAPMVVWVSIQVCPDMAQWIGLEIGQTFVYLLKVLFILLGIAAFTLQKRDYDWFLMAGGRPQTVWKMAVALLIVFEAFRFILRAILETVRSL